MIHDIIFFLDADVFENTSVSRVQVYVRIRPNVQGDVTSITGKGAVSVEATDLTQVGEMCNDSKRVL